MARQGDERRIAAGEKRAFRFGTSYAKFAIGCNMVVLVGFACFLGAHLASDLRRGEDAEGAFGGFVLLSVVIVLLAIYGGKTLKTRIEIDGDSIVYISGKRRLEGSLRDVSSLEQFSGEAGEAYRIRFRDGTRIDFSSDIEDADVLRAYVQRVSGMTF